MKELLFDFISRYTTLTEEDKSVLNILDIFKSYSKGQILLKQGEYASLNYFVLKGCIRQYSIIKGEEKTIDFYTELKGVNMDDISKGKVSEYYLECTEDSLITSASPEMEKEMLTKFPKFEQVCLKISEELLIESRKTLTEFKLNSPEERYHNLTVSRPDLLQRLPQKYIASYLGITPQSLSRIRARIANNKNK
jgi:CRP-like cAMP-binding protein